MQPDRWGHIGSGTMSRLATPSGLNWNLYLKEYPWFVLTETMQPDPSSSTPNIVMLVTSNPSFFAPGFFANRSGITIWATPGVPQNLLAQVLGDVGQAQGPGQAFAGEPCLAGGIGNCLNLAGDHAIDRSADFLGYSLRRA